MQSELEELKRDFAASLEDLTFNSRPIITTLTIIAQENVHAAQAITKAIEEHIAKAIPAYKLPALYLVDSICKNVGSPYTHFFGINLYKTFTHAYTLVPDQVRVKLRELFQTWKQPTPSGEMLFSPEPIKKIESFLISARAAVMEAQRKEARYMPARGIVPSQRHTATPPNHYPRQPSAQNYIHPESSSTAAQLLVEIDSLIASSNRALQFNPTNTNVATQLKALKELYGILTTSQLPQQQLDAIKLQLSSLASNISKYSAPPIPFPPQQQPYPLVRQTPTPITSSWNNPPAPNYGGPAPNQQQTNNLLNSLASSGFLSSIHSQQATNQAFQPEPSPDPAALIASLQSAGLLPPQQQQVPVSAAANRQTHYSNQLFAHPLAPLIDTIVLTTKSLTENRVALYQILYKGIPNQCSTCGRRFYDTELGKKERDAHLDYHFRVNKRLRENEGGQSRSWYMDEETWITYKDIDEAHEAEEQPGIDNGGAGAGAGGKNHIENKIEEAKKKYISAPTDALIVATPCPICKEKFKTVWHNEAEEWVWMNAVEKDGKIYHATCYEEAGGAVQQQAAPQALDLAAILALGKRKLEQNDDDEYDSAYSPPASHKIKTEN